MYGAKFLWQSKLLVKTEVRVEDLKKKQTVFTLPD